MDRRGASVRVACATFVCALLAGAAIAAPAFACENTLAAAAANTTRAQVAQLETSVLCLVNEERAQRGLRPLAGNQRLELAASRHARDMVERDYFAHESPGGRELIDRVRAAGYARRGSWKVGENIAWGTYRYSSPRATVNMWMRSPGHRALILERSFTEAGVGMALGAPKQRAQTAGTYVLDFGRN